MLSAPIHITVLQSTNPYLLLVSFLLFGLGRVVPKPVKGGQPWLTSAAGARQARTKNMGATIAKGARPVDVVTPEPMVERWS